MVVDIRRDQVTVSDRIEEIRPVAMQARAQAAGQLAQTSLQVASIAQEEAKQLATDQFNSTALNDLNSMYQENKADAVRLQDSFNKYWEGYEKGLPLQQEQNVRRLYLAASQKYLSKAQANQNKVITNEATLAALKQEEALKTSSMTLTEDLFSDDPLLSQQSFVNFLDGAASVDALYSRTGADGMPLFTPQQRFDAYKAYVDGSYENAMRNAFDKTPDKLGLISRIENDEFFIPEIEGVTEAETNLTSIVGEDTKQSTIAELNRLNLQSLNINAKMRSEQDRAKKQFADAGMKAIIDAQSNGQVVQSSFVDELAPYLDPAQLRQARAIQNAPYVEFSNPSLYRAYNRLAQNNNLSQAELDRALEDRQLSQEDYSGLSGLVRENLGRPVDSRTVGRNFLMQTRGSIEASLSMGNAFFKASSSVKVAEAMAQYEIEYAKLAQIGTVTKETALELSKKVLAGNLTEAEMKNLGLSEEKTEGIPTGYEEEKRDIYLSSKQRNNGDHKAAIQDPTFKDQMRILKDKYNK